MTTVLISIAIPFHMVQRLGKLWELRNVGYIQDYYWRKVEGDRDWAKPQEQER